MLKSVSHITDTQNKKLVLIRRKLENTTVRKVVELEIYFPTVPKTQKSDIPIKSYDQNNIQFSVYALISGCHTKHKTGID